MHDGRPRNGAYTAHAIRGMSVAGVAPRPENNTSPGLYYSTYVLSYTTLQCPAMPLNALGRARERRTEGSDGGQRDKGAVHKSRH